MCVCVCVCVFFLRKEFLCGGRTNRADSDVMSLSFGGVKNLRCHEVKTRVKKTRWNDLFFELMELSVVFCHFCFVVGLFCFRC